MSEAPVRPAASVLASVDETMLAAGGGSVHVVFDIDQGYEDDEAVFWGSKLSLYDEMGVLLKRPDGSPAQGLGYSDPDNTGNFTSWLPHQADSAGGSTTWPRRGCRQTAAARPNG